MMLGGARDYIGSVRIPLREVMIKGSIEGRFAVMDENRNQTGDLNVKIAIYDLSAYNQISLASSN
jgi:hypothetical protein